MSVHNVWLCYDENRTSGLSLFHLRFSSTAESQSTAGEDETAGKKETDAASPS